MLRKNILWFLKEDGSKYVISSRLFARIDPSIYKLIFIILISVRGLNAMMKSYITRNRGFYFFFKKNLYPQSPSMI